jgi:hypothetical protein
VIVASEVKKPFTRQSGQVAVEYILLLVVGVAVWLALVQGLVSRNANSPGTIVRKWVEIINFIGSDSIEETN